MTPSNGDLRINSMSAVEGLPDTIASAATRAHDPGCVKSAMQL